MNDEQDDRDDRLDEAGHALAPIGPVARCGADLAIEGDQLVDVRARCRSRRDRSGRPRPRAVAGCPSKSRVPSRNRATATSSAAMSAAEARGPAMPASRAMRRAGNRSRSGARKSSRPAAMRSGGAAGDGRRSGWVRAYWMGSRISGVPSWAFREPSTEADGGVHDALRVDHHLDRVVVDIVQPVRLDDLQALVGEGRRVDGDLGAHRPRRVTEGLRRGSRGHHLRVGVEERAARRGQDQGGDVGHAIRRRGTARWPSARSRWVAARPGGWRYGSRAGHRRRWLPPVPEPAASPDGHPRRASPCWPSPRPCRRSSAARTGPRLTMPPVPTTTRSTSSRVASCSSASSPPTRSVPAGRSRAPRARSSARATAAGRNRAACSARVAPSWPVARATIRKSASIGGQDVDRLAPDGSGRPQEGDAAPSVSRGRRRHTGS